MPKNQSGLGSSRFWNVVAKFQDSSLAKLQNPIPRFLLGGKNPGKSNLVRFFVFGGGWNNLFLMRCLWKKQPNHAGWWMENTSIAALSHILSLPQLSIGWQQRWQLLKRKPRNAFFFRAALIPKHNVYGIFTYIYHKNQPNATLKKYIVPLSVWDSPFVQGEDYQQSYDRCLGNPTWFR